MCIIHRESALLAFIEYAFIEINESNIKNYPNFSSIAELTIKEAVI